MRERLRHLTTGVAIYGAGDAAISVVNFLLLPLYVRFLTPADYGALTILTALETFLKLINRWGLDGAFMRYYLERDEGAARARFTSTILIFIAVVDGVLLVGGLLGARQLTTWQFDGSTAYVTPFRLMLINSFLLAFTFVPFHVMRLANEAVAYSALTFARSAGQVVFRLLFIIVLGMGVTGVYVTDLLVTIVLLPVLWRWTRGVVIPSFSREELRTVLRFALPRLPSGLAQQLFDGGNKILFKSYAPLGAVGVYGNGFTLGTAVKFYIASFETAWAPFYYQTAKQPNAETILAKMTTYGIVMLVLLCAGTAAVAHDLVLLMLNEQYLEAIPIVPIIAVGLAFQGVYLLTSIGLNITSHTEYYPLTTFVAAGVGLAAGLVLMPALGLRGAAWAFLISFFVQATLGFVFARRFYPIPYEYGRIARAAAAGVVAGAAPFWIVPATSPLVGVLARGSLTVAVFATLLWISGFFRPTERAFLQETIARLRSRGGPRRMVSDVD